ncbi:branched-chain amino acid ABC transporter permease [Albidovulum sediminicola]|uniref:Branched-chain amino acid ABC transporter permease n=1 Tax=Albidovulum sediminicola TaxID=2984331 RepID=A0ABT2Z5I6_9RHOB|nr:branched-chain amino acid ABC transporter permease [Defluviimonas sp. WL0075]MCV2866330.1 branched-chain amino acid ABC transporter permease [Defluviimonas sp. WL0075]
MRRETLALLAVFAVLALVPVLAELTGQTSWTRLVGQALIYGMAAASLNFILGYGGMISFGHATFFGIGGYVVGILYFHFDEGTRFLGIIPGTGQMLLTLPAAILVSGLAAALVGALSLRTGGVQFIMITLAFAQMFFFLFISLKTYGGEDGVMVRRTNSLPGLNMRDKATLYWVILVVAAGYYLFLRQLVRSSFGQIIAGIRQNERRMTAMGVATYRYKLAAFILSGMGAGLAGALMVNFLRFASPDMLHWTRSGELMVMVILGGVGTLAGPFVGAAALTIIETLLSRLTEHWMLPVGVLLLAVVLLSRGGLMALIARMTGGRGK